MKTKQLNLLLFASLFMSCLSVFARQSDNEIILTLTDLSMKSPKTYILKSLSYSCSNAAMDSASSYAYDANAVSMEFRNNMDQQLLKWVAGKLKGAKASITVNNKESGKKMRSIVFENVSRGSSSESFSSGDGYGYVSAQVTIYTNKIIVDDVVIESAEPAKATEKKAVSTMAHFME